MAEEQKQEETPQAESKKVSEVPAGGSKMLMLAAALLLVGAVLSYYVYKLYIVSMVQKQNQAATQQVDTGKTNPQDNTADQEPVKTPEETIDDLTTSTDKDLNNLDTEMNNLDTEFSDLDQTQ